MHDVHAIGTSSHEDTLKVKNKRELEKIQVQEQSRFDDFSFYLDI